MGDVSDSVSEPMIEDNHEKISFLLYGNIEFVSLFLDLIYPVVHNM